MSLSEINDSSQVNWGEMIVVLTAFATSRIKLCKWASGRPPQGFTAEDLAMETITRHLSEPQIQYFETAGK